MRIVGVSVLVTLLGFVLNVVSGLRYTRVSAEILFDMRLALFRHLQRLSPRYYARTPLGQIVSRLNSDIGEIQRVAAEIALAWIGQRGLPRRAVVVMLSGWTRGSSSWASSALPARALGAGALPAAARRAP